MNDRTTESGCIVVGEGVTVTGEFSVPGRAVINGSIAGDLQADELLVGATGKVVGSIKGLQVIEMPRNGTKGMCCGAGGARMWMEESTGKQVNVERSQELLATGATKIAVACPFCMTMITDGVTGAGSSVPVLDISEVVASRLLPIVPAYSGQLHFATKAYVLGGRANHDAPCAGFFDPAHVCIQERELLATHRERHAL